jgi:hypothetical protein
MSLLSYKDGPLPMLYRENSTIFNHFHRYDQVRTLKIPTPASVLCLQKKTDKVTYSNTRKEGLVAVNLSTAAGFGIYEVLWQLGCTGDMMQRPGQRSVVIKREDILLNHIGISKIISRVFGRHL